MIDYKVGDWVERTFGGDYPEDGIFMGNKYQVKVLDLTQVSFEGINGGWKPTYFRISKSQIINKILSEI
jgi:hypothetical protein